jgi:hypothetical protein
MALADEVMRVRMRIAEAEQEAYKLEVESDALVKEIREILDPHEYILDIDTERAGSLLKSLAENQVSIRKLKEEIRRLKKEIGEK